jgi:RimJ/RimL family protein N-acetyltransferase
MSERTASGLPIVNIVGALVALGPLHRDLIPLLTRWGNDLAARRNISTPLPQTVEQLTARYERYAQGADGVDFAVYEVVTWQPIGTVSLFNLDYHNGLADFGILIGEPTRRGTGYGTEATLLMLDYAFTALGLRSVGLTVAEWNVAGQRAYARAGFKEYGRRRSCRWMGGRWWDDVYMDALASEFVSPVLAEVLQRDMVWPRRSPAAETPHEG